MNYANLMNMTRRQLIEAQEVAIMEQDTLTLQRIANIMTNFNSQVERAERRTVISDTQYETDNGLVWLNDEVEDAIEAGEATTLRARFTAFLTREIF